MPRHNEFSNFEMRNMICVYAQENFKSRRAARRYLELYPNNRQPDHRTFKRLYDKLGETGSFRSKPDNGRQKMLSVDQEEEVLIQMLEDPETSTRRLSAATGVSKSSVSRIARKEKLFPFHFTPVQNLLPGDYQHRLEFCNLLRQKQNNDPFFFNKILFTDEATFTRRGVFNWRNSHSYDTENPHLARIHSFQHEFSINVWCGILGDTIFGPIELPARLNGESYLNFLQNDLPIILEDVPLAVRHNFWFMQDGAPAHYSMEVRGFLNNQFPHRWIGRGSEYHWPARSPDLNPLDFFFWGYLKSLTYKTVPTSREELWGNIQEAVNTIRNKNQSLFKVRRNFGCRLRKCIYVAGQHFENLL